MSAGTNVVALVGNLTRDPELKTLDSGTSLCSMRVAVAERYKSKDEWIERSNYFSVTAWGGQAENCARYLSKGRQVAISGRLRWREWESDKGKREAVEVVADSVQFVGGDRKQEPESKSDDIPF